jgi:hypothetical protein
MIVRVEVNPEGALSTAEIGRRLQHKPLLSDFISNVLGVPPDFQNRRCLLWTEASFQLICVRLAEHAKKVADEFTQPT